MKVSFFGGEHDGVELEMDSPPERFSLPADGPDQVQYVRAHVLERSGVLRPVMIEAGVLRRMILGTE